MLGKITHDEVMQLMSESMAMALPTRWYEGFPMSIAESLSVGTPVIGPNMGNVGNLIEEGVNGYKFENSSDEEELLNSLRKAIGKAWIQSESIYHTSLKNYQDNYTEDKNYEMLMEIYSNLL